MTKTTTYQIERRDESGQWNQSGCWGGEYATGMTREEAEDAVRHLQAVYSDVELPVPVYAHARLKEDKV